MSKRKKAETGLGSLDDLLGKKVAPSSTAHLPVNEQVHKRVSEPASLDYTSDERRVLKQTSAQGLKPKRKSFSVYVSPDVAMRLEMARPKIQMMTGESGYTVNKSTITEAALIYLLDDFERLGEHSYLLDYIRRYKREIGG